MTSSHRQRLLANDAMIVAPGVADTLGALAAQRAGFRAVFLSGSAVAQVHLGRPDIGLTDASELAAITRRICERCEIPVCVDIDTGFGNAFNVHRTVKSMALAGAACVQMEDQQTIKPVAKALSRPVVAIDEMQVKIRAALEASAGSGMLVSARTDARYEQGLASAIERALAYAECGADLVFVEGLTEAPERAQLRQALGPDVPRVFNTAIIKTRPDKALQTALDEGYRLALGPTWITAAVARAMTASMAEVAAQAPPETLRPVDRRAETDIATLIDADHYLQHYRHWESPND